MVTEFAADNLSAGYTKTVISDISFRVRGGEIMTLIGPNGSGKSTVLKTLAGTLKKHNGTVLLNGRDMTVLTPNERAKQLAVMLTERVGASLMTCREVVETGRYPYTGRLGRLTKSDRRAVDKAIALTEIGGFADADFSEISDGQRQRVMLAKAICQEPKVLLLDEPTSYLDIHYKVAFLETLRALVDEEKIVAVVSMHELDMAERISDYSICIKNGGVFAAGAPSEIFKAEVLCGLFDLPHELYIKYFQNNIKETSL